MAQAESFQDAFRDTYMDEGYRIRKKYFTKSNTEFSWKGEVNHWEQTNFWDKSAAFIGLPCLPRYHHIKNELHFETTTPLKLLHNFIDYDKQAPLTLTILKAPFFALIHLLKAGCTLPLNCIKLFTEFLPLSFDYAVQPRFKKYLDTHPLNFILKLLGYGLWGTTLTLNLLWYGWGRTVSSPLTTCLSLTKKILSQKHEREWKLVFFGLLVLSLFSIAATYIFLFPLLAQALIPSSFPALLLSINSAFTNALPLILPLESTCLGCGLLGLSLALALGAMHFLYKSLYLHYRYPSSLFPLLYGQKQQNFDLNKQHRRRPIADFAKKDDHRQNYLSANTKKKPQIHNFSIAQSLSVQDDRRKVSY
jgi:hypothetical protein